MKWKEKKHKPRFLYPANISFLYAGEIKDILKGRQTQGIHCQQTWSKRMAKVSSSDRMEMM